MDRYKATKRVSVVGIIANIFLFFIKIIVAVSSRSQGLIADAINSGTDIFTSLMTYVGNKMASKPSDKEHPYGHGKVEYVFSLIISMFMLVLSYKILQNSITSILQHQTLIYSYQLIIVCITTIIVKFSLYIYTSRIGRKYENVLITAASQDHRNDVLVTTATLIGIICSKYGYNYIDGIVGICISIWIAYVAIKIFISAYYVLIDTDMSDSLKEKIRDIIKESANCQIDSIKATPVGINYILIIEISLDDEITIEEGHEVAENIKQEVCNFEKIMDAIVHVNPKY